MKDYAKQLILENPFFEKINRQKKSFGSTINACLST